MNEMYTYSEKFKWHGEAVFYNYNNKPVNNLSAAKFITVYVQIRRKLYNV